MSHGMVIENQQTSKTEDLGYCKDCFLGMYEYKPITEQISFGEKC